MNNGRWIGLIELLKSAGVKFAVGLADTEIKHIENQHGFCFPPDLREFLHTSVPTGDRFTDWRSGDDSQIKRMLRWPLDGIMFDVEQNEFWLPEWGPRPSLIEDARAIVERRVGEAPRLIPIYAHRMIPDRPRRAGNPILSVYQTDIIYYGFDLDDYLRREFDLPGRKPWPSEVHPIEFWDVDHFQTFRPG